MSIEPAIPCDCGGWVWHDFTISLGLVAVERRCPRCKRRKLIVTRGPTVIATVSLVARKTPENLRSALTAAGLSPTEVSGLVELAELMATM